MPHADCRHGNEGQSAAYADTLDLGLDFLGHRRDHRTRNVRVRRTANEYRDAIVTCRRNAAWMQYGASRRSEFLRLVIMNAYEEARRRHDPRVSGVDAIHIGADLAEVGIERSGDGNGT